MIVLSNIVKIVMSGDVYDTCRRIVRYRRYKIGKGYWGRFRRFASRVIVFEGGWR